MGRITRHDLDVRLRNVNAALGREEDSYSRDAEGHYHANIGTLTLAGAYGGTAVHVMATDGGGVRDLTGYRTSREVAAFLDGMLAALDELRPRDSHGRVVSWDCDFRAIPRQSEDAVGCAVLYACDRPRYHDGPCRDETGAVL